VRRSPVHRDVNREVEEPLELGAVTKLRLVNTRQTERTGSLD
jgi:hypothetical protein